MNSNVKKQKRDGSKRSMAWFCVPVSPKKKHSIMPKTNEKSAFSCSIYHLTLSSLSSPFVATLDVGIVDDCDIKKQRNRYRDRDRDEEKQRKKQNI